MRGYPDVYAVGTILEVELERGITLISDVGDVSVATELAGVWGERHDLAAHIARLSSQLARADSVSKGDPDLRATIAALRHQIDEFERSCGCL